MARASAGWVGATLGTATLGMEASCSTVPGSALILSGWLQHGICTSSACLSAQAASQRELSSTGHTDIGRRLSTRAMLQCALLPRSRRGLSLTRPHSSQASKLPSGQAELTLPEQLQQVRQQPQADTPEPAGASMGSGFTHALAACAGSGGTPACITLAC